MVTTRSKSKASQLGNGDSAPSTEQPTENKENVLESDEPCYGALREELKNPAFDVDRNPHDTDNSGSSKYPDLTKEVNAIGQNNSPLTTRRNPQTVSSSPRQLAKKIESKRPVASTATKTPIPLKDVPKFCSVWQLLAIAVVLISIYIGFRFTDESKQQQLSSCLQDIKSWLFSFFNDIQSWISTFINGPNKEAMLEQFEALMSEYNQDLPEIGKSVLRTAFNKSLEKQKSPVVILMIASASQSQLLSSFSQRLASIRQTGNSSSSFPPAISIKRTHSNLDIENFFTDAFESQSKQSVLLLEHLEQLNPKVAMVFHQFVDGENSRIHGSFVILTLKYDQELTVDANVSMKKLSQISTAQLHLMWKNALTKDSLDCLINRLGEYTVVLVNNNNK